MASPLQLPKKARVAVEFVVAISLAVVALSEHHPLWAIALGSVAFLVLLLEFFGAYLWNSLSAAIVRTAVARGVVDTPDPDALGRERELRAALLHLLTELEDSKNWLVSANDGGEFWKSTPDVLWGPVWYQQRWFVSGEQGLESLYAGLSDAYREIVRVRGVQEVVRKERVSQIGHGPPVRSEDQLPLAIASIERAQDSLRETIAGLRSRG